MYGREVDIEIYTVTLSDGDDVISTDDTVNHIHHLNYSTNYSLILIVSNCAGNNTTMLTIFEGEFNTITLHKVSSSNPHSWMCSSLNSR